MRRNYNQIQDFLDDDRFVQWVVLGKGNAFWQQFLVEKPDKASLMHEARQLILEIQEAEGIAEQRLDQKSVWHRITTQLELAESVPTRSISLRRAWLWAAGIVCMFGISWLAWQNHSTGTITYRDLVATVEKTSRLVEKTNSGITPLTITLDDGTLVTLDKGSKLSYPEHFDQKQRAVVLTGEAFFEVARDASRPFYIYTNEVVTKVLGTSFRIRAFEQDHEIIVQVRTGRVSVYKQKRINLTDPETDGLVLLPNQQAVFSRPSELFSRRLVARPIPLAHAPKGTSLTRYDEVPASKILRDIEAQYGITILFDDILDHCILTTTLGDDSLYDTLDLLCKTIGATYKEVDAQIIIESQGCR